jgi:two-component system nitrate/nitrite response regulator NarL
VRPPAPSDFNDQEFAYIDVDRRRPAGCADIAGIGCKPMRRRPFATIIVGPNPLLREGLARVLGAAAFRIVASAPSIDDLVLDSKLKQQAILLIIDATNHAGEAVELIAFFKKQHPTARVAVLATDCELSDMVAAFRSGANAYFITVASCDALIKSLDLVMLGETILPPEVLPFIQVRENTQEDKAVGHDVSIHADAAAEARNKFAPRLSGRERNVLRCLLNGDANKVIARKIDVENRTQAALWAMKNLSLIGSKESTAPAKVVSRPKVTTLCVRLPPETHKNESERGREARVGADISAARQSARGGTREIANIHKKTYDVDR